MHAYSISNRSRLTIIFWIALASVMLSSLVNAFLSRLALLGPITTSAVFFGLFFVVDRFAWRCRGIASLFATPDLSGEWDIKGKTSGADNVEREWFGEATITQNWTTISIVLETSGSISESKVAGMKLRAGRGGSIVYSYENMRKQSEDSLTDHRGTCELHFEKCNAYAKAYCFNDRSRKTIGEMTWIKKQPIAKDRDNA
tara:strand:- start:6015 stop:6614 length:600 start_codon:yes stop_codon:yes gene_type:complete